MIANHPQAMADLRARLAAREPMYAIADHTVDTSGQSIKEVIDRVRWVVPGARPSAVS